MHGIGIAVYVPVLGLFTGRDEQMSHYFSRVIHSCHSLVETLIIWENLLRTYLSKLYWLKMIILNIYFYLFSKFVSHSYYVLCLLILVPFFPSTWPIHLTFQFISISCWNHKSNKVLPKQIHCVKVKDSQTVQSDWCLNFLVYKGKDILAYPAPFLLPLA